MPSPLASLKQAGRSQGKRSKNQDPEKIQTPTSKLQRRSKFQAPSSPALRALQTGSWSLGFGFWVLDFGSSLDLGSWCLDLSFLAHRTAPPNRLSRAFASRYCGEPGLLLARYCWYKLMAA